MSEQERVEVVRPARKTSPGKWDAFPWVHLDNGKGDPLCGKEYDMNKYLFRLEVIGWDNLGRDEKGKTTLCRECAYKHFQFDVETIQHGQARPYADSWYKYRITDLQEGEPRDEEEVLEFCRKWVCFSYDRADMPHPFAPQLISFNEHRPGEWRYDVRRLYTG